MHQLIWSTHIKKTAVILSVVGSAALGAIVWQWGWLSGGESGNTPNETMRNLGLVIAGVIAFPIAIWRAVVADRQSRAAKEQAKSADEQSKIAQQGLLYDRYQRGSQMMGDNNLAVRLAGIYALQRLAQENPLQYDEPIIKLFCAFLRNHTEDNETYRERLKRRSPSDAMVPEDVKAALSAIRDRCQKEQIKNRVLAFRVDLSGAHLAACDLSNMDLSNANLYGATLAVCDLSGSVLNGANLDGTNLRLAKLSRANFFGAALVSTDFSGVSGLQPDFSGAIFMGDFSDATWQSPILRDAVITNSKFTNTSLKDADLSGAFFATNLDEIAANSLEFGMTQAQLDEANWDFDKPPKLNGLLDAETLHPLVLKRQVSGEQCGKDEQLANYS